MPFTLCLLAYLTKFYKYAQLSHNTKLFNKIFFFEGGPFQQFDLYKYISYKYK